MLSPPAAAARPPATLSASLATTAGSVSFMRTLRRIERTDGGARRNGMHLHGRTGRGRGFVLWRAGSLSPHFTLRLTWSFNPSRLAFKTAISAIHHHGAALNPRCRPPNVGVIESFPTLLGTFVPPAFRPRMIASPGNHMVIVPIKIMVQPSADPKSQTEGNEILAVRTLIIDNARIIGGHINYVGISRDNINLAIAVHHGFFRIGLQVAQRLGLGAQPLNGVHHVIRLIEKGLSQLHRPRQAAVQQPQHIGIMSHGLDAAIPRLLINRIRIPALGKIIIRHGNLPRLRRRWQDLRNERIRVKRNRSQQLIKLGTSHDPPIRGRRRRRIILRANSDSGADKDDQCKGDKGCPLHCTQSASLFPFGQ